MMIWRSVSPYLAATGILAHSCRPLTRSKRMNLQHIPRRICRPVTALPSLPVPGPNALPRADRPRSDRPCWVFPAAEDVPRVRQRQELAHFLLGIFGAWTRSMAGRKSGISASPIYPNIHGRPHTVQRARLTDGYRDTRLRLVRAQDFQQDRQSDKRRRRRSSMAAMKS
jgi:hypothetical protein